MIALGILEIFLSQIPNFHKLSMLSVVAAFMSFGYSSIGVGLAFAKVISGMICLYSNKQKMNLSKHFSSLAKHTLSATYNW